MNASTYILAGMIAHLWLHLRSVCQVLGGSQSMMLGGMGVCLAATVPFFLAPLLWMGGLIVSGYASGCTVASWGYYLKAFTHKNERIKSCRRSDLFQSHDDCSQRVAMNRSPFIGLSLSMLPCNRYSLYLDVAYGIRVSAG